MANIDPTVITAVTGIGVLVAGTWLNRRGQNDQRAQQIAAARVAEQTVRLQESTTAVEVWRQISEDRSKEIGELRLQVEAQRNRADASEARRDNDRERFDTAISHLNAEHQRVNTNLSDMVKSLSKTVLDEAIKESAKDAVKVNTIDGDAIDKALQEDTPD